MVGPEEQREFRLGWSLFRRAHQAAAKRSHEATHRAKHATYHDGGRGGRNLEPADPSGDGSARKLSSHATEEVDLLTDAQWERVRELLPRQKPGEGRPRRDDRQVLRGILWIMESGSSWRDLPEEEFGPNSTLHGRYRKWCEAGLWPRIVEALGR
jgi:Putative transposase of IS4/5 family (DUF4096)